MPSFACPKCAKVLKTSAPIPAGKNVKCPGCGHVFTMPAASDGSTGIQASKPGPGPRTSAVAAPQDLPKRRRPDPEDDDEAPRQASRRAKARADDDDDDADDNEEDERPVRRGKKKKAGSKTGLLLVLGGVGLLVILGITGFFLLRGGSGGGAVAKVAGAAEPLAFVPANCDFVMGGNLAILRNNPGAMQQFEQALQQQNQLTPAQLDLIRNAERGIMAGTGGGPAGNYVLAFTSVVPLDPQKVREAFNAGPAESVQGKTLYKIAGKGVPGRDMLGLPHDKMVVVGSMPDTDFVKVLDAKGKLSADMQAQVDTVRQNTMWGVLSVPAMLRDNMQQVDALAGLPGGAQAVPAIKASKLASFAMDAAKDARLQIELRCASDQDATQLETFARNLWEKQAKPFLGMAPLFMGNQPGGEAIKLLVDEVNQTFKIQRQGASVSASVAITEKTLKELEKLKPPAGFAPPPGNVKKRKL